MARCVMVCKNDHMTQKWSPIITKTKTPKPNICDIFQEVLLSRTITQFTGVTQWLPIIPQNKQRLG